MTRPWLALALALFAAGALGCNSPADHKLPGASITPHLEARVTSAACGDDVALNGDTVPDVRYRYTYDALGRLSHATGAYATGPDDSIDYAYDFVGHATHTLESRGTGEMRVEITTEYDTLGDLLDYTWDETEPSYHDSYHYVYSAFTDAGQPTREVVSELAQPSIGYQLDYDPAGRIMVVVEDGGQTTTYSYDDVDARTVTIDTSNGAYHDVIVYDDQDHEQSETWDGTDPSVIAGEDRYDWDGSRLLDVTYRSGSTAAPHDLATVEVDTLRYDCPTASARTIRLRPRSR